MLCKLTHAVMIVAVLLASCHYQGLWIAGAIESVSLGCYQPTQYLLDYFNCKPTEFQMEVVCEGQELSLECHRSKKLVLFAASTAVSSKACTHRATINTGECSACMQLNTLKGCQGGQSCYKPLASNLLGTSCISGHIALTYTCVSGAVMKGIRQDRVFDGEPCSNISSTASASHVTTVTHSPASWTVTVTRRPDKQGGTPVNPVALSTAHTGSDDVMTMSPHEGDGIGIIADWGWTAMFVKVNKERFTIYVLLSISVGAIFLLLLVIFRLLQVRQRRSKSMSLPESTGTPGQASSPQSTETAALLSAQDGIELLRFKRTGSRNDIPDSGPPRTPVKSVPPGTGYYPESASQASTLLTPDRSEQDGGGEYIGFRSLGRSYNNPYRHDSYRTDGYRTINK